MMRRSAYWEERSIGTTRIAEGSDGGYAFALWACNVASTLARSRSFRYRGIDLQHAFRRASYAALIDDPAAYEMFLAEQRSERSAGPGKAKPTSELVAEYLSASGAVADMHLSAGERMRNVARRAATAMLCPPRSGALWMLAMHRRFVRHLEPVMQALDESYRVVTFDDPVTDEYVREQGYLSLNIGPGNRAAPLQPFANPLSLARKLAIAYDAAFCALWDEPPRGIVVPDGNDPIHEIVNLVARKLGIPTVCVQQGWSPMVDSSFRDTSFSSMVVWGDWFTGALVRHSPKQRICALGNHMIDRGSPRSGRPRTIGFFLQPRCHLVSDDAWSAMLDLIEFCARELPGARVLVREHPTAALDGDELRRLLALPGVELVPPDRVPLRPVLARCDIVVSIFAATILEGIGAGALPVIVNTTSMPSYYPDVAAEGAGIEVKDFAAAREALRELWSQGIDRYAPRIAAMQRRLFTHCGSDALEQIVAHVRSEFRLATGHRAQR